MQMPPYHQHHSSLCCLDYLERVGVWRNSTCRAFVRFKILVLVLEGIETSHHPCHHQARSLLSWVKSESVSYLIVSDSLWWTTAHQAPLSMEFSRQEYWSGCHSLLHGIFLPQGSNSGLLHCRQILYHLSHQGSLWWVFKAQLCNI